MTLRAARCLAALCLPFAALAQPADRWLASAEAAAFRERVVQLALIYGESSGIDPHGLRIVTRRAGKAQAGCAPVRVQAFEGEQPLLDETVQACRHDGAAPAPAPAPAGSPTS